MKKTFLIVLAILSLVACAPKAAPRLMPEMPAGVVPEKYTGAPMVDEAAPARVSLAQETSVNTEALESRMVIKNANLRLVVDDVQVKMNAIAQLAEREGGFVLSTSRYETSTPSGATVPEAMISIRVPSDRFDAVIAKIEEDATDVLQDDRSGQDVTAQYVDLQARLKARQAAAARLEQLLQQAADTDAVLDIFNKLESINAEIESLKGQIKYYEEASSFSLINVTLISEEKVQPIKIGKWQPQGTVNRAIQSLIKFLQGFVNFLIWVVLFVLPVLLVVFGPPLLIAWGVVAAVRRHRSRKKQASEQQ